MAILQFLQDSDWRVVEAIVITIIAFLLLILYTTKRGFNTIVKLGQEHQLFILSEKKIKVFCIHKVQVEAGNIWQVYRDGIYYDQLQAGPHIFWGIFHTWNVLIVNLRLQFISLSIQGNIKGPPIAKMKEEMAYHIEVELGLACRISNIETFLQYHEPISMLSASIKDAVYDIISNMTYDQYGHWATTLRNIIKERLQGGMADAEHLVGMRVEEIYLSSFKSFPLFEYNKQYLQVESTEIFISYAHEDEKWRIELEKQLSNLQNQGLILSWHDRQIGAGTEWEHEIEKHLETAQIILLLISPDFMASKFCYSNELRRAIERHNRGDARVIPVILRPVDWQGAPFAKLQVLPTDAKPILSSNWHNTDEALLNVAMGIREAVENFNANS